MQSLYRYIDKKTYLNWGLTSDWLVSGQRERRSVNLGWPESTRKSRMSREECDRDSSFDSDFEDDNSASEGYGEMTAGSIEKLLHILKCIDDEDVSITPSTPQKYLSYQTLSTQPKCRLIPGVSTFIDIGSGYGKVVFHAKMSADVSRAVGVEYVEARAKIASKIQNELLVCGPQDIGILDSIAQRKLHDCSLFEGDATTWKSFDFSHIYMYDRVFSKKTLSLLAKKLNKSSYIVLISYRRFEEWQQLGLKNARVIRSITMRTTGGQNFKAYIYVKE
jgi:tRNA G46 methylase TrmB